MNTDSWGDYFDYFLQFHVISQQLNLLSTFSSSKGEIHELAVNLDNLPEFFMETLVQGTQATQAKVPKQC